MQNPSSYSTAGKTNGMAITSLIAGILSWVLALILACLNWVIVPLFALATMGVGLMLYYVPLQLGVYHHWAGLLVQSQATWLRIRLSNPAKVEKE